MVTFNEEKKVANIEFKCFDLEEIQLTKKALMELIRGYNYDECPNDFKSTIYYATYLIEALDTELE